MLGLLKALLIDIGNSRIKFTCLARRDDEISVQYCDKANELESSIMSSQQVLIASVGKSTQVNTVVKLCQKHRVSFQIVETKAEQFGLRCAYEHFENFGVDRWLAMLAAREITSKPVAILDLGTANTCDIIIGNEHQGGWIAPGFNMMKQSLLANTQKVFADQHLPSILDLGRTTSDCVNLGCLASLQGFVLLAENFLVAHNADYEIFVTGGDKNLLLSLKNQKILYFSNLVLMGLRRFL